VAASSRGLLSPSPLLALLCDFAQIHNRRQSPRHRLLQRLPGLCQLALFWFTYQSVDVLGHDHEAIDEQFILLAHRLQSAEEEIPCRGCAKFWLAVITAEGEGMVLTGLLEVL